MYRRKVVPSILLAFVLVGGIFAMIPTTLTTAQIETETTIKGGFADVQTFQDDDSIVVTITKAGAEPGEPVVVEPTENSSGVVVTPVENTTVTEPSNNVTVIEPDGNVTVIEDGNVTNIDNTTVVVTPENGTVTETPGDVIVVDPPACECPAAEEPPDEGGVSILPGENDTVVTEPFPEPFPEPAPPVDNETGGNGGANGGNGNGGNDSGNGASFTIGALPWMNV